MVHKNAVIKDTLIKRPKEWDFMRFSTLKKYHSEGFFYNNRWSVLTELMFYAQIREP